MRFLFPILIALLISGCSSLKVETDFDPNVAMNPPKNFYIVHKPAENEDTLVSDRIIEALQKELISLGYKNSSKENADFLVLFHIGVTTKSRVVTDYQRVNMYPYSYGHGFGYGYRGYGGHGTVTVAESKNYSYKEAKLIVDAVIPTSNRIFWRGTAKDQLQSHDNPQERIAYINKVLKTLMKKFPK